MKDIIPFYQSCKKIDPSFSLPISHLTTTLIAKTNDRFAAKMRPVWGLFNSDLGKYVAPSEYLAIYETLYYMRH